MELYNSNSHDQIILNRIYSELGRIPDINLCTTGWIENENKITFPLSIGNYPFFSVSAFKDRYNSVEEITDSIFEQDEAELVTTAEGLENIINAVVENDNIMENNEMVNACLYELKEYFYKMIAPAITPLINNYLLNGIKWQAKNEA